MKAKTKTGLLLVVISVIIGRFDNLPNVMLFVQGFSLSLGIVFLIKGMLEQRKEKALIQ